MESLVRREEGTSSSECIYTFFLLEGRQVHALRRTGTSSNECRSFPDQTRGTERVLERGVASLGEREKYP